MQSANKEHRRRNKHRIGEGVGMKRGWSYAKEATKRREARKEEKSWVWVWETSDLVAKVYEAIALEEQEAYESDDENEIGDDDDREAGQ